MKESEVSIIPGQVVKAFYTGSETPVDLTVQIVTEDERVVLSPDRKKTVITKPEVLLNGGEVGRFRFVPLDKPHSMC